MTYPATLISKSKNGRSAMVVVKAIEGETKWSATRHVERQGNSWVGKNPDPRTLSERMRAALRVDFAKTGLRTASEALRKAQEVAEHKDQLPKLELNVNRATAVLKVAEGDLEQTFANFPLQVQFEF